MNCWRPFRSRYFQAALLGAAFLLPSALGAKKPAANTLPGDDYGTVVALSPFEVTAQSMEFSQWIKLTSPHFVLYTDSSQKDAKRIITQLEMLHQATQFFLRRKCLKLPSVLLVLPTARSDWRKIGSRGAVEWQVACSLVGSTRKLLLAEYNWQTNGLASVWAIIGINQADAMNLEGPLWFSRGIAAFFRTAEFDGDTLTIGKQGMDGYWIQEYGWMRWPRFFSITGNSPEFTKDDRAHDQYEGQCALFVHYLLTHPEPAWTARLLGWSAYLKADNEPTEESFKEVFQHDWKGWEQQLRRMLNGGTYTTGQIRFPPAALQFSIESSTPAVREMRELFVLSQILNQRTKESVASLDALLERGLKTDSLRELLADACSRRDRSDAQLAELRRLIAAGSTNPDVYCDASKILFRRAVPTIAVDARMGDEAGEIRAWCIKARELEPLHLGASGLLAWTEALAPVVEKSSLETIVGICRALDGNAPTDSALAALAVARWRSGGFKQARSVAELLQSSVFAGKAAKSIATDVLARLDAAAQEPTAVGAPGSGATP